MLRLPLIRAAGLSGCRLGATGLHTTAAKLQAPPEQIEVFIDDIPVLVDPGTTVLQVQIILTLNFVKVCWYAI